MNRTPRNLQLLAQIGANNPFKKTLAPALFDISGAFAKDMEAVGANRKFSLEGRRDKAREHLREALRARQDRKKAIADFHAQTERTKAKVRLPDLDRTDEYAVRLHFRMLDLSYDMTPLERMGLMTGPGRDQDFIDAVSREKPWVSGFREKAELDVLAQAKTERLAELHGPLQATIAERKSTYDEILMVDNMLLLDLATDSGLEQRDFDAEVKAIESKAAAATDAPKINPDDPNPTTPEHAAMFSQEELKEIWRPFDELFAGNADRGAA